MAYVGFKNLKRSLARKGVRNPGAVAASIGRKKYGKAKFQKAAAAGKTMEHMRPARSPSHSEIAGYVKRRRGK